MIFRRKKRTLILTLGVAIAICLLSGTILASNSLASSMIIENLDKVKIDYSVSANSNKTTQIINKINNEMSQFEEFTGVYPAYSFSTLNTLLVKGNGTEDWSFINQTSSYYDFINQTSFFGIDPDYLSHPNLQGAITFLDGNYSISENGIYINKKIADKYNLQKGDYLTFRTFSREETYNITRQIGSFKILGVFEISNRQIISQMFQGSWYSPYFGPNDNTILVGFNSSMSLAQMLESEQNEYVGMRIAYGVLLDHSKMPIFDTKQLQERTIKIYNRLTQALRGEQLVQVSSNIQNVIETTNSIISFINNILVMVSIPVLLLTWFLIKTNYQLSFTERNREIGLLKSKGATESQIRTILNVESFSIGLIGSIFGLFFGSLASGLISKYVYNYDVQPNFFDLLRVAFTSVDVIIPWLAVGIIFSYISSKKPIKQFVQRNPSELLGYYESSHSELEKKKSDILIMLLGVFPIVSPLLDLLLKQSMYFYFISILISPINLVLLILGPFLLVYAIVKFLCVRSIGVFTKLIHAITSKFDKNRAFFIQKSILNNQARAAKIIFIIGMFISFLVMNTTVIASEQKYQEKSAFLSNAGGIPFYISSPDLLMNGNYSKFSEYLIKQSNLSITHVIPFIYESSLRIEPDYTSTPMDFVRKALEICKIDPNATLQATNIPDDYFVDMSYHEAMNKLINTPNATLIPLDYAKSEGLKIGDILKFEYDGIFSESASIDIVIVGFYNYFPIVSLSNYQSFGLVNVNTANDTKLYSRSHMLVAFPDESVKDSLKFSHIREALENFDSKVYVYSTTWDDEDSGGTIITFDPNLIFDAIINFIMVEKIFLVVIVSFGLAVVMFASINEKSRQFALLRARGVPTKVMYQIQLSEGAVFIVIGLLIGLSGILSAYSFILQINNLTSLFSAMQRTLYIPWVQILTEFGLSLMMFTLIILWSVKVGLKKSDVNNISEVFRLA